MTRTRVGGLRQFRHGLAICTALVAVLSATATRGAEPINAAPRHEGLLVLSNGDRLRGELASSERPGEIVWQSPAFVEPLRFSLHQVQTVMFDTRSGATRGDYRVALSGGDTLYGALISVDNQAVVVQGAQGTFRVKRAAVALLSRRRPAKASQPDFRPLVLEKVVSDKARLELADGTHIYGKLVAYDARSKTFSYRAGNRTASLPAAVIADIVLADAEPNRGSVRLEYADGTRFSGDLLRMADGHAVLKAAALDAEARLPLANLRFLRASSGWAIPKRRRGEPVLLIEGGRLHGRLVASTATGHSPLAWQLSGASTASTLRAEAAASVVFGPPNLTAITDDRPADDRLFLRSGDVLNCTIVEIAADETTLRTANAETTRISNVHVKAVELGQQPRETLAEDKLSRLLTVPRLQRDDPPTHVLGSVGGDYLRGRLIGLSGDRVTFQIGPVRRDFPRDRIACIVWLNAARQSSPRQDGAGTIQATEARGVSMTLTAATLVGQTIIGRNELLGECRLPLDRLVELRFGPSPSTHKFSRGYQSWNLVGAVEPKSFADDSDATDRRYADASPLVGRPAPDFKLELLDGAKLALSGERGKVVVLDFWTSWCAPCVKGLPQTAELIGGFSPEQVRLIAVNFQESRDEASRAIARMELDVRVALDGDGQVAAAYGAVSIPYTVVIGADGKVVGAFAGYGPGLADELKQAIETALPGP